VHDPSDPSLARGDEQRARAFDRLLEARVPVVEADPVGVVESADSLKAPCQRRRVVKLVREGFDLALQRVRTAGMKAQRPDAVTGVQQPAGDVRAGVAERPRDQVKRCLCDQDRPPRSERGTDLRSEKRRPSRRRRPKGAQPQRLARLAPDVPVGIRPRVDRAPVTNQLE
jgi:hypothetical protein